jgi:hypothetical protein
MCHGSVGEQLQSQRTVEEAGALAKEGRSVMCKTPNSRLLTWQHAIAPNSQQASLVTASTLC